MLLETEAHPRPNGGLQPKPLPQLRDRAWPHSCHASYLSYHTQVVLGSEGERGCKRVMHGGQDGRGSQW